MFRILMVGLKNCDKNWKVVKWSGKLAIYLWSAVCQQSGCECKPDFGQLALNSDPNGHTPQIKTGCHDAAKSNANTTFIHTKNQN